jgi:methyl-accepting chemotaxis protein
MEIQYSWENTMSTRIVKSIIWNIIILLLFYTGSFLLTNKYMAGLDARINALSYHNELTITLKDMLGSLQRAESNRRGFIITQNNMYIEGYNIALHTMETSLSRTKELMVLGGYQDRFIDSIRSLAMDKIRQMQRSMQISTMDESSDSLQIKMTNEGREIMNSLRRLITLIISQQDEAKKEAFADYRGIIDTIGKITIWTSMIMIAWGGIICYRLILMMRRRI